jgi:hypothetical protein
MRQAQINLFWSYINSRQLLKTLKKLKTNKTIIDLLYDNIKKIKRSLTCSE